MQKRYFVRITVRALCEIDEALAWLCKYSPVAAARWHDRLMKAVLSLQHNPDRCGLAPEAEWYPGQLRQLLYGRRKGIYRILFEIQGETVYILRVRHGSQALLRPGEI